MLRSTVGFYSDGKPRARGRARDARFYTRVSQLGWLEATQDRTKKSTEVPLNADMILQSDPEKTKVIFHDK